MAASPYPSTPGSHRISDLVFPEGLGDLRFADVAFGAILRIHETPVLQLVALPMITKVFNRIQAPSGIEGHDIQTRFTESFHGHATPGSCTHDDRIKNFFGHSRFLSPVFGGV